jgi:hypothetical protein
MTTLQIDIEDSRPVAARCEAEHLEVVLADGRVLQTPLWWYPRLARANSAERAAIELTPMGVHWPIVDEDISIASMLRGQKAPGAVPPAGTP